RGWNLMASGVDSSNVGPGESVDLRNTDGNLSISKASNSNDVIFNLSKDFKLENVITGDTVMNTHGVRVGSDVTLGSTGLLIADGPSVTSTGINAGSQRITQVAAGTADTDAVNVGQLQSVSDTASKGWNLMASGANSSNVAPGESVDLKNTDGNLLISKASDSNDVIFNLSKDFKLDSVTTGNTVMTTDGVKVGSGVILGSTGLVIADGPSVTSTGINAGSQRITQVAAGMADTDAVNVSQLNSVVAGIKPVRYYSTNDGGTQGGNYDGDGATGIGSVAAGVGTQASGEGATALGAGAAGNGKGSAAIGRNASASADGSVALGDGAKDGGRGAESYTGKYSGVQNNTVGTVSVGDAAKGDTRTISNVADAKEATDAVNLRQLDYVAQQANRYVDDKIHSIGDAQSFVKVNHVSSSSTPSASGVDATAIGVGAVASGTDSLVVGQHANASAESAIAIGSNAVASGADSVAMGKHANVSADNAVAIGANSVADRANSVSVGSAGSQRQVTNVAAATADTDAVNLGQLNQGLITAKQYTDGIVGSLRRNSNAGVAAAIATANLPQAYVPGRGMTSVGVSSYQGQSAIAVGVSAVSESGRWVFKFSGSANTRSQVGVGAGVGYQW
ncbi:YadA family autotransporter adhesin, partial [Xylella taiwanensis]